MSALEIDAFSRCIRCQEYLDFWIVLEGLLGLHAFLTAQSTMDDDEGFFPTEECSDTIGKVVECVAVFGKDNQLLTGRNTWLGNPTLSVGRRGFSHMFGQGSRGKNLSKQACKLAPFCIGAALANR